MATGFLRKRHRKRFSSRRGPRRSSWIPSTQAKRWPVSLRTSGSNTSRKARRFCSGTRAVRWDYLRDITRRRSRDRLFLQPLEQTGQLLKPDDLGPSPRLGRPPFLWLLHPVRPEATRSGTELHLSLDSGRAEPEPRREQHISAEGRETASSCGPRLRTERTGRRGGTRAETPRRARGRRPEKHIRRRTRRDPCRR